MAGTQLGSFTYDMVLEYAKFEDAFTKAQRIADQHATQIQRSIQRAVDGVGDGLKDLAGKVVAAFAVDKLVEFGKQAIDTADELGKTAQKVGVTVESLSALQVQAKLSGVGLEQLQSGMEKLARNAADAAGGNKESAAAFAALGVAIKDANGNLRPMQDLLGDVAKKFSGYADSAQKTADAQRIFGKSGAELIPVLNELGDQGLAKVTEQAREFGAVISTETAKQAEQFNDNLSKLGFEAKGFASAVASQLLPSLNQLTAQMVEAGKTTDGYADSAGAAASAIRGFALGLVVIKEVVADAAVVIAGIFDIVKASFGGAWDYIKAWGGGVKDIIASAFSLDEGKFQLAQVNFLKNTQEAVTKTAAQIKATFGTVRDVGSDSIDRVKGAYDALLGTFSNVIAGSHAFNEENKKGAAPLIANAAAADEAAKAAQQLAEMFNKDAEAIAALRGRLDPVQGAYQAYVKNVIAANDAYQKEIDLAKKAGAGDAAYNQIKKDQADRIDAANQALERQLQTIAREKDIVTQVAQKEQEELLTIGLTGQALEEATAIRDASRIAIENYNNGLRDSIQLTPKETAAIKANADAFYKQKTAAENSLEVAKGWQSIWATAGNAVADTFAKVLVEGGSLFKGLRDLAKQTVEQIIAYFLKLQVINPILNAIFGGSIGFSMLPSMANAAGGGSGIGGGIGSLFGGGTAGGSGSLFSPSSWIDAGKNLFSGFSSLWGPSTGAMSSAGGGTLLNYGMSGGGSGTLLNYGAAGSNGALGFNGLGYGGYGSALGQGLGIAGGVVAGYNEYNAAGGGIAGLAGGAAYGFGTYFAGAALSTGVAAAAAGGMSAGIAAGLSAIPVVGWIAIAAMVINMVSGGKLFGTAGKPIGGQFSETIGPSGASLSEFMTLKGQRALFGGAYYHNKNLPIDPAAQKAADDFYAALVKGRDDFAKQFNIAMGDIVGGQWIQHFDKKGNPTTQDSIVNGVTYHEDQQHFAERLQAENYVAVLEQMGIAASKFVDGARDDADKLMQATQDIAQAAQEAQADLSKGIKLLGDNTTIGAVINEAIKLQGANESLAQTYARIAAQTQDVQKILEHLNVTTNKTGTDFVEFADNMAKAAGGLQALDQEVQKFISYYYSAAEQQQMQITDLAKIAKSDLEGIGLSDNTTMAQFKTAFDAVKDSLSAEDLAKWIAAGDALGDFTAAVTQAADQVVQAHAKAVADFENFMTPFRLATDGLDDFEHAMLNLGGTLQQNIAQANALARAAGMQGASAEDIAKIIEVAARQGAAAFQQLEQNAQQLASTLYGQDYINGLLSQLQAAKAANDTSGYGQILPLLKQITDAQKNQHQAADNSRFLNAQQLAGMVGEIVAVGGGSIGDVLKTLGIPFDAFAKDLHVQSSKLSDFLQNEVDKAKAELDIADNTGFMAEYLKDIRDTIAGKPLSFFNPAIFEAGDPNASPFGNRGTIPGGAPRVSPQPIGGGAISAGSFDTASVVDAIRSGTREASTRLDVLNARIATMERRMERYAQA